MSKFDSYFPEFDDSKGSDAQDLASLPFPAPLASLRTQFRQPTFDPDSFLLENQRHGQLDDLLRELRSLLGILEEELVKGVENDYEDFIGLGNIEGSKSKVDTIKAGVTGIAVQIKVIEGDIQRNLDDVRDLLSRRREIQARKGEARAILRISRTVDELSLVLTSDGKEQVDLDDAVETYCFLQRQIRRWTLPEFEEVRVDDLRGRLLQMIRDRLNQQEGDGDALVKTLALVRNMGEQRAWSSIRPKKT